MSRFARLFEENLPLVDVSTSGSTEKVNLNAADKFSVEVTATVGASIAHLEGSNVLDPSSDADWTEIDSQSLAEGDSVIFEQPNVAYLWSRITLENDDVVDVSSDNFFLVIGDAI